jgi:hypothetical protein
LTNDEIINIMLAADITGKLVPESKAVADPAQVQNVQGHPKPMPSDCSSLSAAIASLSNVGAEVANGISGKSFRAPHNLWDEVLRYVHLLEGAVQPDEKASWNRVGSGIEQLYDHYGLESSKNSSGGISSVPEVGRIREVQATRETKTREVHRCEVELQETMEEARRLRLKAEDLRTQLEAESQARQYHNERQRADARALMHDELRMEKAVREVEELRGHVQLLRRRRHSNLESREQPPQQQQQRLQFNAGSSSAPHALAKEQLPQRRFQFVVC